MLDGKAIAPVIHVFLVLRVAHQYSVNIYIDHNKRAVQAEDPRAKNRQILVLSLWHVTASFVI